MNYIDNQQCNACYEFNLFKWETIDNNDLVIMSYIIEHSCCHFHLPTFSSIAITERINNNNNTVE